MPLEIKPIINDDPVLALFYGAEGTGKSTLVLDAPSPLYIPIAPERPPRHLRPDAVPVITSAAQFTETLRDIYKNNYPYQTLVIDSLDALEVQLVTALCAAKGWANIEAPGYGKGQLLLQDEWRKVIVMLDALRKNKGYTVLMTALATATNHEEPGLQSHAKWSLRMLKRSADVITQVVDAMLFINTKAAIKSVDVGFGQKDVHVEGGGSRWLFADGRPHMVAKNRLDMPDQILLPKEHPWSAIAPYFVPILAPEVQPEGDSNAPASNVLPDSNGVVANSELTPPIRPEPPQVKPLAKMPPLKDMLPPDRPSGLPPLTKEEGEKDLGDSLGENY